MRRDFFIRALIRACGNSSKRGRGYIMILGISSILLNYIIVPNLLFTFPGEIDDTLPFFISNFLQTSTTIDAQSPSWYPFNDTNPHVNTWCPSSNTQCHNSPLCTPCDRRHLLILATGRSGSTTLLRMLNLLPNVRLSGENANTLFQASRILSNLKQHTVRNNPDKSLLDQDYDRTEGAWSHNAIPKQTMACVMQHTLYAINPPPLKIQQQSIISVEEYDRHTILGMKTIRFHKGRGDANWTPKEAAAFLQENFPCSRIVVNVRSDVQSQLNSIKGTFTNYTSGTSDKNEASIEKMNSFLTELNNLLSDDYSRLIDMTNWTKDVQILNDLVKWMGFKDCEFQAVGHENMNGYERDETLKRKTNDDDGGSTLLEKGCWI